MQALLSDLTLVFAQIIDWAGDVLTLIINTPVLLLVVVGFTVSGFVLGWVSRLFRAS